MLTHFSLFTGIGGLDLAAEWAGFQTVGQCEWADYPTKVLEKHWPEVPRWRDIRSVTAQSFYERTGLRTVTAISGGFPCQPFSTAGKRKGAEDDRYLWPEMLRVVSELQPTWAIGENVAGIVSMVQPFGEIEMETETAILKNFEMVLETIRRDFERIGYESQPILIPACAAGARHRRDRVAIMAWNTNSRNRDSWPINQMAERENTESPRIRTDVAYTNSNELQRRIGNETQERCNANEINIAISKSLYVANTESKRCGEARSNCKRHQERAASGCTISNATAELRERNRGTRNWRAEFTDSSWWDVEPDVGRVANGIFNRVDRLKCLGNAVVPQQFYPIFQAIADIESGVIT